MKPLERVGEQSEAAGNKRAKSEPARGLNVQQKQYARAHSIK